MLCNDMRITKDVEHTAMEAFYKERFHSSFFCAYNHKCIQIISAKIWKIIWNMYTEMYLKKYIVV